MIDTLKKYFKGDGVIWAVIILLSIYSMLAVYSATDSLAYRYQGGNTFYYFVKHGSILFLGLVIIYITHHIPYKIYSRLSQLLLLISIPMLLITLFMGANLNEASRWISLPFIGLTIQTSDLAKLALIMYLARVLSLKQGNIHDLKGAFLPLIIPILLVCMLILPANFSTAAILMATSLILLFIGRVKFLHLISFMGLGLILVGFFIGMSLLLGSPGRIETWKNRLENFSNPESDGNYQAEQSKIAVATGGVIGKGPGKSTQRNFLPHPYSDFIFAIIIEEYGILFGAIPLLLLYMYLLYRAGVIISKCKKTFPAFLTIGLTLLIVFQALINMAVTVNLFPVTGQTLPWVSMGGSSILFTGTAFGIILSVSRSIKEDQIEVASERKKINEENINIDHEENNY